MFIQMLTEQGTYLTLNKGRDGLNRSDVTATKGSTFRLSHPFTHQDLNPSEFVHGMDVIVEVWGLGDPKLLPHWATGALAVGPGSFPNTQFRMRVYKVNHSSGNIAVHPGDVFGLGSPLTYPWGKKMVHKWLRSGAAPDDTVDVNGQGDAPTAGDRQTFIHVSAPFVAHAAASVFTSSLGFQLLERAPIGGAAINVHFSVLGTDFLHRLVVAAGDPVPPANSLIVPFPPSVTPCANFNQITLVPAWDDPSVTTSRIAFKQNLPISVTWTIAPGPGAAAVPFPPGPPGGLGRGVPHTLKATVTLLESDPSPTFVLVSLPFPFLPTMQTPTTGGTVITVTFDVTIPTSVPPGPLCFSLIYNTGLPPGPTHFGGWFFNTLFI